jgi:hypothetical protein
MTTNAIIGGAVAATAFMLAGFGGYFLMRTWASPVQKNVVVSHKIPDVKTENPIHEYKDKYVDTNVVFKPIPRSFSV